MNQIKQINTGKVQLLAVMVPKDAYEIEFYDHSLILYKCSKSEIWGKDVIPICIDTRLKGLQYLGISTEQTEEQWREIIPDGKKKYIPGGYGIYYLNYKTRKITMDTAKESGLSLLEANGITEPTLLLKPL